MSNNEAHQNFLEKLNSHLLHLYAYGAPTHAKNMKYL